MKDTDERSPLRRKGARHHLGDLGNVAGTDLEEQYAIAAGTESVFQLAQPLHDGFDHYANFLIDLLAGNAPPPALLQKHQQYRIDNRIVR